MLPSRSSQGSSQTGDALGKALASVSTRGRGRGRGVGVGGGWTCCPAGPVRAPHRPGTPSGRRWPQ